MARSSATHLKNISLSVCLSVCLSSIRLCICLSVCQSACMYVCPPSVCVPVYLSVCRSVCLFVCLSFICLCTCLFVCLSICLSVSKSVCLSIPHPSACLPAVLSVCWPSCLSVGLPVCLSACLLLWLSVGLPACLPVYEWHSLFSYFYVCMQKKPIMINKIKWEEVRKEQDGKHLTFTLKNSSPGIRTHDHVHQWLTKQTYYSSSGLQRPQTSNHTTQEMTVRVIRCLHDGATTLSINNTQHEWNSA